MPKSLRAALVPIFVMALSSMATRFAMTQEGILAVATALAGLVVGAVEALMNHRDAKKMKRAEAIVPGITSIPKGSEVKAMVIVNDPKTPDPPSVIESENRNTP